MSGPLSDVRGQISTIRALLDGEDVQALYEAARGAEDLVDASEAGVGSPLSADEAAALQQVADEALAHAAGLGHPEAAGEVAWRIYYAEINDRAREAFALAQLASSTGAGQYLLGLFRYSGFGCAVDPAASFAHHQLAADQGYADAMFELYVYHSRGIGTAVDEQAAVAWCVRAAEAGSPRAMANLGGFYATGQWMEADQAKALHWYGLAAEAGHGRAAATLGVMYAQGQGTPPDEGLARKWLERSVRLGYDPQALLVQCQMDPHRWLG